MARPKTGGRKKGSRNVKKKALDKLIGAGEQTPLEMLLETMRDTAKEMGIRLDCAKAAAPYVHSRKAQDLNVKGELKVIKISAYDPDAKP